MGSVDRSRAADTPRPGLTGAASAPQGVGIMLAITRARDGMILEVNDTYCKTVGRDRSELVGKHSTELGLFADESDRARVAAEVMTKGSVEKGLVRIRLEGGAIGHCSFTISRIDIDGEPCFMVGAVDVTAQQAAEEALRASEARFAATFRYAGVMMMITRPDDGLIVDVNEAFLRDTGYSREQLVGRTALDVALFVNPEDSTELGRRLQRDGFAHDFEVPVRNRAGELNYGLLSATLTYLDGAPHVILAIINTTERRRAEEALKASEERYRDLVEQTADGVASVDDDGRILDTNPAMAELFGRTVEELTGSLWTDYLDPADLAGQPFIGPSLPVGGSAVFERRVRRPDGAVVEVEVHTRRTGSGTMLGTVHDIGVRKAAEQERARLYRAIEQSAESIVIAGPDGTILYVNPAFERETGYTRAELLGQSDRILSIEDDRPSLFESIQAAIDEQGTWSDEVVSRAKDGLLLHDIVTASPVRDEQGNLVNFVAVYHNVDRERELEEQLRQAQKMEAVGRLAGGVAHDFNNLLTAISGFTELAAMEAQPGSELAEYLAEIRASTERATALTRQLLAFGRRAVLQQRILDLNQVVAELAPMLRRIIGEDIELQVKAKRNLGRTLADRGQLEQVIVNLAANARDAMPSGGRLTIETDNVTLDEADLAGHPEVRSGQFVRLSMSDTGIGMDTGTANHIFEPFYTTKGPGSGTGLGLATVFGIVRQSGGRVGVDSEPGMGSRFQIDLPVADGDVETAENPVPTSDTPSGLETVLVVEDEPAVLGFAARLLETNGYTVLKAANGHEAVEIARSYPGRIDLIFSDIVMPGLSGHETSARIATMRPQTRHLLASGYNEEMARRGATPVGVPFIEKPYSASSLLNAVRQALDGE
jgi:PAS domain S-box-containing protein